MLKLKLLSLSLYYRDTFQNFIHFIFNYFTNDCFTTKESFIGFVVFSNIRLNLMGVAALCRMCTKVIFGFGFRCC